MVSEKVYYVWFKQVTWLLQKDFFHLSPAMFFKLVLDLHVQSVG